MHASLPEGGRWPDPTSLHDGPRGVVARIVDPASQQALIVKRLRIGPDDVAAVALRLLGVAMVDHPGVGAVQGLRPVEGAVEVVREDLPHDWVLLVASPTTWSVLEERAFALLDALSAVHSDGWVHGALRPANVRWRDDGPLMVVDGGLPQGGRPEGLRGVAGDLWDVGALLWGACTGTVPRFGEPLPPFVPRADVPQALGTLLANLLEQDPLARYDLAADVASELRSLGDAAPPDRHGPSPRPGPIAPALAMTGPVPWRRPHPSALPERCPTTHEARWRTHQPPLVGRGAALDALWSAACAASAGPIAVLLVGARGMGRTRVARRFSRELARGGWAAPVWLSHDGDALQDGLLGAIERRYAGRPDDPDKATEFLARRLARARGVILEDVAEVAAALRRTMGPTHPGEPVRMDPARRELSRGLTDDGWRGRSVVIIDDAHRPKEPWEGLALARTLLRSDAPVLVVATLDLDALDDERVAREVAELELAGARKVVLRPVTADDIGVILSGAPEPVADEVFDDIVRTAEGCPEVARQLVLALMDLGTRGDDGRLRWPAGLGPEGDWLGPRSERVAERSGQPRRFMDALHLASLAADGLPASVIHGFLGAVVVEAAQSGLWSRHRLGVVHDGSWVLSPLVREALGRRASGRPDVAYLERRLAEAHGRRPEGRAQVVAARHGLLAGDAERALPRLLVAVRRAWASGRRDGLEEAARLAGTDGAPMELWLWAVRADAEDGELRQRAVAALRDGSDDAALAQLLVVVGERQLGAGQIDEADAAFQEAEALAKHAKLAEAEARAVAGKGSVAHHRRNFSGAEVHFTRAVNRMAKADAPRSMARVMMEQGLLARRQGRFREAAELYDEAADGFREADDLVGAARARLGLARVRSQQLDLDAARSWVDVAHRAGTDLLDPVLQAEALLVDGDVRRLVGDAGGAASAYHGYLGFNGSSEPEGVVFAQLGLAQLALARSDAHEAYERANGAAAALEKLPHHWLWAPYRLVVAALLADRGDHMQTWQWLWSASELGLGDTVDRDTVALLTRVCNVAKLAGWGNVIRVSANLAVEQLERLGERDAADRVKRDITGIILK